MPRIRLAVLTLIAITFAVAGCGKSSSSAKHATLSASTPSVPPVSSTSAAPTPPLTRTDLIARADAICGQLTAKENLIKVRSTTQFELILPQLVAYQQSLFTGLRRLTPPTSMSSDWGRLVDDAHTMVRSMIKIRQLAQAHQPNATSPYFTRFAQARVKMRAIAGREGFKDCANY